jgi:hypothetical protein
MLLHFTNFCTVDRPDILDILTPYMCRKLIIANFIETSSLKDWFSRNASAQNLSAEIYLFFLFSVRYVTRNTNLIFILYLYYVSCYTRRFFGIPHCTWATLPVQSKTVVCSFWFLKNNEMISSSHSKAKQSYLF